MTKRFNKSFRRCPGYDEERLGVASRAWCLPGVSVWLVVPAGRPATRCQPCLPALVPGLYFFALCPDFPFKVLPFVCPVFSLSFPIFLIPFLFFSLIRLHCVLPKINPLSHVLLLFHPCSLRPHFLSICMAFPTPPPSPTPASPRLCVTASSSLTLRPF